MLVSSASSGTSEKALRRGERLTLKRKVGDAHRIFFLACERRSHDTHEVRDPVQVAGMLRAVLLEPALGQLEAGDELKELEAQIQHDLGLLHLYCGEAQDAGGRFVRAVDILNAKLDDHGQGPHDRHTSPIVQRIKKKLKISLLVWGEALDNTAADDDREALEFALNIYEQGMAVQMDPSTGASECLLSFVRVGDE